MEEVTLRAVQRAMPGHGRARIHSSLLTTLGIADNDEVEVVAPGGTSLTLAVFADSLVEKGQIRISEEDLGKLRISDGLDVIVRRKIPVGEQVRNAATGVAEKVTRGVKDLGESVSEKTSELKEGGVSAAQEISSRAKDVSAKVAEEVSPLGEKIAQAGRETAAKIQEMVPTGRFNKTVETALKQLNPDDHAALKKILLASKAEAHAVPVAQAVAGRSVGNLTIPHDVAIAAVQREGACITPEPGLILRAGDIVYMTGSLKGLDLMTTILEGS